MGEPWLETNVYMLHDTGNWKDLNLKFALLCWRDARILDRDDCSLDREKTRLFLYERISHIIHLGLRDWDSDGDGLIENSGFADQTYDVWVMTGSRFLAH